MRTKQTIRKTQKRGMWKCEKDDDLILKIQMTLTTALVGVLRTAIQALFIQRVDDKDYGVGALEVVAPQRANLFLATNVPHVHH
jgi:hypothetical protein